MDTQGKGFSLTTKGNAWNLTHVKGLIKILLLLFRTPQISYYLTSLSELRTFSLKWKGILIRKSDHKTMFFEISLLLHLQICIQWEHFDYGVSFVDCCFPDRPSKRPLASGYPHHF